MQGMEAGVRTFQESDLEAVQRLVAEMREHERSLVGRRLDQSTAAEAYTQLMLARCASHAGVILVAEVAGDVVGFAAVFADMPSQELDDPVGTYALVSDLAVATSHRGQGFGRRLLAAAEEYARSHGANELRVGVLAANEEASRLYRSAGYAPYVEVLRKRFSDSG